MNKEDGCEKDRKDEDGVMVHHMRSDRGVIESPKVGVDLGLL